MKLAEALIERKSLTTKISRLRERLLANTTVQEGDTTSEDPNKLIETLAACYGELEVLINRVNQTNANTLCEGVPLCDLITKRDLLVRHISMLRDAANNASNRSERAYRNEIRLFSTIDVPKMLDSLDNMSAEARRLDGRIQAKNWEVDLL